MKDKVNLNKIVEAGGKKRKRINSRTKGSTFERRVCEILNQRFGVEDFCRSPGSGAFASTHKLPSHLKIYGDIITPAEFNFTIECKKGYNKEALGSFFSPSSNLRKFLKQAEKDADFADRLPMIIFKQDRNKTITILKLSEVYKFLEYELDTYLKYKDWLIVELDEVLNKFPNEVFFTS